MSIQRYRIRLRNRNPFPQWLRRITLPGSANANGDWSTNLSIFLPTFLLPCTPSFSRSLKCFFKSALNLVKSAIGPDLIKFASSLWKLATWLALSLIACQIVAIPSGANSGVLNGTSRVFDNFVNSLHWVFWIDSSCSKYSIKLPITLRHASKSQKRPGLGGTFETIVKRIGWTSCVLGAHCWRSTDGHWFRWWWRGRCHVSALIL